MSLLFLPGSSAFFHQDSFVEMILSLSDVFHRSFTVMMNKTTVARLQLHHFIWVRDWDWNTNLTMTWDSWLKDWYEKEKRCHGRSGKGFWGKRQNQPQHIVVNNKQFAVSLSVQPSTWKIWISNLTVAFCVLWDGESFYESVSLPFIGWKLIVSLHYRSPPKIKGFLGSQEGDADLCRLCSVSRKISVPALLPTPTNSALQVHYSSLCWSVKHQITLSL